MSKGRLRRFLGIVALAYGVAATSVQATADATTLGPVRDARIDAAVRFVMNDRQIDGLALGIVRNGRIVAVRTYGYADLAHKRHVDALTVFSIGSLTKSFTAAMVRSLVRDGRLAGNDALGRFVPKYPEAASVTIDDLLAQTGGIPDYAQSPGFSASSHIPVAPDALIALASEQSMLSAGTFAYANTNYLLAAVIAQRMTRTPYAAMLQRSILRPLGLRRTAVANAFVPIADRARGNAPAGSATLAFGCADLQSDLRDMLAWSNALLGGRVVPAPRTIGTYDDGFFLADTFGRRVAFAGGYVPGFSSYWMIVPGKRLSVIVLSNANAVDLGPLTRSVVAAALDIREDV